MSNTFTTDLHRNFQTLVQKFLWDPEPKNTDPMNAIWTLGVEYPAQYLPQSPRSPDSQVEESTWPPAFLDDFESRLWMTYRSEFAPIARAVEQGSQGLSMLTALRSHLPQHQAGFTDDGGWGCMIRSAQCVLANALQILRFGREWRRGARPDEERKLLQLFADDPRAPFSIHRFVQHGEVCGTSPGQWFGPNAATRCIRALAQAHNPAELRVYISRDGGDVYEDAFRRVAVTDGVFHPTLVLIPHRLGISGVTDVYREALKACIQMRQSVGIAGGRPSSSHYFVGVQGDYLFYLDPHTSRPQLPYRADPAQYSSDEVDSCHTRRLRRLDVKDMDPSMMIAFLIKDEYDWEEWRHGVSKVQGKSVIHVSEHEPAVHGHARPEAIAEVEVLDEDDSDEDALQ